MVLLALLFMLMNFIELDSRRESPQYDVSSSTSKQVSAMSLMTYFLILMRLVPLDLVNNGEIGKIVVSKFIERDAEMIKINESNGALVPCKVQSMQMPEELACVNHIFSDKTGTLTKNELEFRAISVDGFLSQGSQTSFIVG